MSGSGYGTPLAQFAKSMNDADPDGARRAASQLWHQMGIAVFFPGDCNGLDRSFIEVSATRKYGKRKSK